MFKIKKKTGCETPEYRRPTKPNPNYTPPPSVAHNEMDLEKVVAPMSTTSFEACCKPKQIRTFAVGTEYKLDVLLSTYDDIVKVKNADVYWSDKDGVLAVCTTPEWKNYFLGQRNMPTEEHK